MSTVEPLGLALAALTHELYGPLSAAEIASRLNPPQLPRVRRALRRAIYRVQALDWLAQGRLGLRAWGQGLRARTVVEALLEVRRMALNPQASVPLALQVLAAPGALEVVLENLLANAGQHAQGAAVTVQAQTVAASARSWPAAAQVALPGRKVLLTVADQGPGIPNDLRPSLFLPGARAVAERAGFGVGLWLSRELVRAQGGDLWLDETEQGASFSSIWPMPKGAQGAVPLPPIS